MDTIEKEIEIISEYDDKLETLKKYFPIGYEEKRHEGTFKWARKKYYYYQTT